MGAKLLVQPAEEAPFEVPIGNTATIGRARENTVCLNSSALISRQHAVIRCWNGYEYQIVDLGSRNGTFVDDQRVVMPVQLSNGARIRIDNNEILFVEEIDPHADEQLQMTQAGATGDETIVSRPVALLVCDIRGFSAVSEVVPPSALAQTLGAWFRECGDLVKRSGGTIDKFIGDALLAYWSGTDIAAPDCASVLAVARKMCALAAGRKWPHGEAFRIAVALHHGTVLCSNVGVSAERDATIIGDAVNTVFRLETLSKQLGQVILASSDFTSALPPEEAPLDMGEQALKGKKQTVRVFGLRP